MAAFWHRSPLDAGGRTATAAGEERAHVVVTVAWLLFLVVLFGLAIRAFLQAPGVDSSFFLYIADGWLQGEAPYLHRWDHKPPLIYLINVVGLALADGWGIWVVQAGFLVGTCLAAYKLLQRSFGTVATLFGTTVLLVYFARLLQGGNLAEQYALLFQFVALALFATAEAGKPSKHTLMALGALGGAAVMLRPNLAGVWCAIGLYWLAYRNDAARKFGWASVGGLAVLLGFVVWLLLAGGLATLAAFWDAAIVYNLHYSDASLTRKFIAVRTGFEKLQPVGWVLLLGWAMGAWRMLTGASNGGGFGPLVRLAVFLLPIELVLPGLSGYHFAHYYLALIPVACVLAAFAVRQLLDAFRKRLPWVPLALFAITAACYATSLHGDHRDPAALKVDGPLVGQIRQFSDAGDPILIWGGTALPYLAADHVAPTRYFYPVWLMRGNKREERTQEFTADVINQPPALIVDMRDPFLPPLRATAAERSRWRSKDPRLVYDHRLFRAFFEFADANYALVKTERRYDIYRKIRQPTL